MSAVGRDDTTIVGNMEDEREISRLMTLRNLEQLRLSSVLGAAGYRHSTMKRTVVHEDREQMLALME